MMNVIERLVVNHVWRKAMNLLKGYGTYLTGWAGVLGGLATILTALAQGQSIPTEALIAVQVGFTAIFVRRALPS
jgi:hypothetical protein